MGCLQESVWPRYGCGNDLLDQGYFYPPICGYLGDASEYGSIPSLPQKDDDSALKCAKNRNEKKPKGFDPKKNAKEQQAQKQERKRVRDSIIKADNMRDFLENTEFGKKIKNKVIKTNELNGSQSVYKVIEDIKESNLIRGDEFYFDDTHKDHLEVFRGGNFKMVLNLDGTENGPKTERALGRKKQ